MLVCQFVWVCINKDMRDSCINRYYLNDDKRILYSTQFLSLNLILFWFILHFSVRICIWIEETRMYGLHSFSLFFSLVLSVFIRPFTCKMRDDFSSWLCLANKRKWLYFHCGKNKNETINSQNEGNIALSVICLGEPTTGRPNKLPPSQWILRACARSYTCSIVCSRWRWTATAAKITIDCAIQCFSQWQRLVITFESLIFWIRLVSIFPNFNR